MTERTKPSYPDWAEQERNSDLSWIRENLGIFWPAAQMGYESVGRGAIVVDIAKRPNGEGYPFGYMGQIAIEQYGDEDTQRLVSEYEPDAEFVTTLFKTGDRVSSYRVRVVPAAAEEIIDGTADEITELPELPKPETKLEPPSIDTLLRWDAEGGCEAACPHHCWVEPDGHCEHGHPSWLLEMGLI